MRRVTVVVQAQSARSREVTEDTTVARTRLNRSNEGLRENAMAKAQMAKRPGELPELGLC